MSTKSFPLSLQICLAMILGLILGLGAGPQIIALGEVGKWIINLIKMVATPLLFFSIVHAILKTEIRWRQGGRMLLIAGINATIALSIGLMLSNWLRPGDHLPLRDLQSGVGQEVKVPEVGKLDLIKTFSQLIPTNFVQPFAENAILSIVVLALMLGFGLRRVRTSEDKASIMGAELIEKLTEAMLRLMEVILHWIIRLIPLAVFAVVAKATAEYGLAPLKGLAAYLGVGLLGFLIHIALTYHIWLKALGVSWRAFWREAREPVIYALGANSSLATLPLTLKALKNLKVSPSASALGACVGTNFNNDGIVLYEAMAVLFVAQAYGMDLSFSQQLLAALTCLVAAMGIAGVPEAGFISLSLVLATVGLPLEILPLLLSVDWVVARGRSVVNVLSDMVVSLTLNSWEKRRVS